MRQPNLIAIELLTESCLGTVERSRSGVDIEVESDELGLPRFGGKALHGVLRDTWLTIAASGFFDDLDAAAVRVLGPARDFEGASILRIGDAEMHPDVRRIVSTALTRENAPLTASMIRASLTDVRHQTSEDRTTGAPARATLRSARVWLRGVTLYAPLRWLKLPQDDDLRCLSAAVLGTRHVGLSRNRGRGHVRMTLASSIDLPSSDRLSETRTALPPESSGGQV